MQTEQIEDIKLFTVVEKNLKYYPKEKYTCKKLIKMYQQCDDKKDCEDIKTTIKALCYNSYRDYL